MEKKEKNYSFNIDDKFSIDNHKWKMEFDYLSKHLFDTDKFLGKFVREIIDKNESKDLKEFIYNELFDEDDDDDDDEDDDYYDYEEEDYQLLLDLTKILVKKKMKK